MQIIFSEEFKKEFRKIKNKDVRLKIIKQLKKLEQSPKSGKPLRHHETSMRPSPKGSGLIGSVSSFPTGNSTLKGGVSTVVNNLKSHRTVRIAHFRIVYRLEKDSLIINCFDHRKDVYE